MTSPSEPPGVPGVAAGYYDGVHSVRRPVSLTIADGHVVVTGGELAMREPLAAVEISAAAVGTPPIVRFRGGAYCEIEQPAEFAALLARQGLGVSRVAQWEGSLRWVAASAILFVLLLVGAYRFGLPVAADVAARQVPQSAVDMLSGQVLSTFDGGVFQPSAGPRVRQARLAARFRQLRLPGEGRREALRIEFRSSPLIGPNALALPSGTVIVTDALLDLTPEDEELLAVLSHEAGHVAARHGLRQMLQNSALALAVTWFIGDVSMLIAAAPTALLQAKYSRDFERDADRYAVEVLRMNDISIDRFIRVLDRMEEYTRKKGSGVMFGEAYISTHPVTAERIQTLRSAGRQ